VRAELFCAIAECGKTFWGQGLIPEAVTRLLNHGFETIGLDTIWCVYYDGDEKSKSVQEKCGFSYSHTEYNVSCPPLDEKQTEHFTKITNQERTFEMNLSETIDK
jgi:RimJ/RimL family protein N-acetyltransferase